MNATTFNLHGEKGIINGKVIPGKNLLELIQGLTPHMNAPCAGKMLCGKCRIILMEGELSPISPQEAAFLSPDDIKKGVRLACMSTPLGSVSIKMESEMHSAKIKTSSSLTYKGQIAPFIYQEKLSFSAGNLEDQRSLETRLLSMLPTGTSLSHRIRKELVPFMDQENHDLLVSFCGSEITSITEDTAREKEAVLVFDIGTTTIAGYLLSSKTGQQLNVMSALNTQKSYGADVISRIEYVMDDPEKLDKLQSVIISQIDDMARQILKDSDRNESDLSGIYLAGNTTMMHIIQGLSPASIARAPFIPVSSETMILNPSDLKSRLSDEIRIICLPSLSGYIGADIISGILACGMAEDEELSLLVDIGTNGEIALGNKDRLLCCSTAAGPAFEGANIQCGSGAIPGALSSFSINEDGDAQWETVGDAPLKGICGSGIIDMTAALLKTNLADYTGRIQDESDWGDNVPPLASRLMEKEGDARFVPDEKQENLFFSQKDLREVQLAKGSVAAGILTLVKEAGYELDDIKTVYLAGGFGSYINQDSALQIGLIPPQLKGKIKSVGNSCAAGLIRCALNEDELMKCREISRKAEYLELSSNKGFQDEYMMQMYFPEES